MVNDPFFKLLHVALGTDDILSFTETEWQHCYQQAEKHCLVAFLFPVFQQYTKHNTRSHDSLFSKWFAQVVLTDDRNRLLNSRAKYLTDLFSSLGRRSCVLKGQGVASLYPNPKLRQPGDIDIWVEGGHDAVIRTLNDNCFRIRNIDYVHSGVKFFSDVEVEVHYRPSWLCFAPSNKRLQHYFLGRADEQFRHYDSSLGFSYPDISFNLVFSLIHINRHIFEDGIGLRQLLDYYYILINSTPQERKDAFCVLSQLHLRRFTESIMYVEQVAFGLPSEYLMCPPDRKGGEILLNDILRGGNFGKYDKSNRFIPYNKYFVRGVYYFKRNIRFFSLCPYEVISMPIWKLWHYCWRKKKRYL